MSVKWIYTLFHSHVRTCILQLAVYGGGTVCPYIRTHACIHVYVCISLYSTVHVWGLHWFEILHLNRKTSDFNSISPFLHSYFHSPPTCPPFPYPFQAVKIDSPDYAGEDAEAAVADFRRRIQQYTEAYQPIDPQLDQELSWLKVFNVDQKYEANRIAGWWEGQRGVSCVGDSVLSQSGQWLADMHCTYVSLLGCVTVHVVQTRVSVLVCPCAHRPLIYVCTYIHTRHDSNFRTVYVHV